MKVKYIDKSLYKITGEILKNKRLNANLSLSQLANKMKKKITKQTLSLYENGESRMKIDTFIEICYILNLNPQEVFDEINYRHLKYGNIERN